MPNISISSQKRKEIIDITDKISSLIKKEGIEEGICNVFLTHTTAAITCADLDPGTDEDMLDAFRAIIPKLKFRHPHNPGHAWTHIASSLIGPGVTVPIKDSEVVLGTWQRIVLIELDGPKERNVIVNVVK